MESFRCSKRSWKHPRFSEDNRLPSVKQSRFHIKVNPWSTFQIILRLSNIVFIVCPGNWQTEVASKSCSAESSRPVDKWCNFLRLDLSWKTMLAMPKSLLSFCLGATYDTPLFPSNLHRWGVHSESSSYLCSKTVCTTAHILGDCEVALQQGRFTYHHDSVLQTFLTALQTFLSSYSVSKSLQHHMNFVRPGTKNKNPWINFTMSFCV